MLTVTPINLRDSGEVEGFYNTVYESTAQVLHERRRRVVERVASIPPCPVDATLTQIVESLHGNPWDIPMALLYSYDELAISTSKSLHLCGSIGVPEGHHCAPEYADLETGDAGIVPFLRQAKKTGAPLALSQTDGSLASNRSLFEEIAWCGHDEASRTTVVFTLRSGGRTLGFYVQGINPRRPYDDAMEMSVVDIARQIEAKWASSISVEEAKIREEMLERRLTDSERRLRHMAQSAPLGMCQITPEGKFEWANDQFHEITGFSKNSSAIHEFLESIAPEDRERSLADFSKTVEGNTTVSNELRLNRRWLPPADELHEGEDASDVSACKSTC